MRYFCALILLTSVLGASAQIVLAPYQQIQTGSLTEYTCINDVNNDGLNDVAVTTSHNTSFDTIVDYKILVYLQNLSGGSMIRYITLTRTPTL